ncbi:MAG: prepilin-type N-terminal cleavage/methylation domain-containing protein [candidate division WOR-3 bacterium]|jgi:prepilin-type N-terminal cleavage/methylation domain-containing protein
MINFSKKNRNSGFTLVELMVVIGIIGIIAVLAIPNFARIQREARLRSACQRTAQHFKQLRERAISTNRTYHVDFPDQYTYRLIRPDSSTQNFKLSGSGGGNIRFGGTGVAGQPPEANMAAPGINGIDFPPTRTLTIDGRGGATRGVVYITDNRDNQAVGINRLGRITTYVFSGGTWQ